MSHRDADTACGRGEDERDRERERIHTYIHAYIHIYRERMRESTLVAEDLIH
jgi:hypothetical protein